MSSPTAIALGSRTRRRPLGAADRVGAGLVEDVGIESRGCRTLKPFGSSPIAGMRLPAIFRARV